MTRTASLPVVVVVAAAALGAGVVVGWLLARPAEDPVALRRDLDAATAQVEALTQARRRAGGEASRQEARSQGLEVELRKANERAAALETDLANASSELEAARARLAAGAPAPAAAGAAHAADQARKGARFRFDQFGVLDEVDWGVVGTSLAGLTPAAAQLASAVESDDPKAGELLAGLSRHNAPLIPIALKLMGKLPGTGANGAFSHPAFQANAIAAALEAANVPLTPDQATALERLARAFAGEEAQRVASYDDATYQLRKEIDEAELRRRFFEAAFALLTDAQREALSPPGVRGRGGLDVFSDGVVLSTIVRTVAWKERDQFATAVDGMLAPQLGLPAERREAARAVVAQWVADLPAAVFEPRMDALASLRAAPTQAMRDGARNTLALLERLVRELDLQGAPAAAARRWAFAIVPLRSDS